MPDAAMGRLRGRFNERSVVEVVATVAAYKLRFLVALSIIH